MGAIVITISTVNYNYNLIFTFILVTKGYRLIRSFKFDIISADYFHLPMRTLRCPYGGCLGIVVVTVAYFWFSFVVGNDGLSPNLTAWRKSF